MSEAARIIHHHSRSFSLAARFLPARVRGDVMALYAWCRTVDDIVDEATDLDEAQGYLDRLKADLLALADGRPATDAATEWIAPLIRDSKVDPRHAIELIEGMEMDSNGFRPRDEADLRRYCYHVAGTVGLMMTQLMGTRDPAARKHAIALGTAMQLTNIARDVREDARRGRSYLPGIDDPLSASNALGEDSGGDHVGDRVQLSIERILRLAEQQYTIAAVGIEYLPRDCRVAVRMALRVYREIGREIVRQDYPILQGRIVVGRFRFLRVAVASWCASVRFLNPTLAGVSPMYPSDTMYPSESASSSDASKVSRIAQARSAVCLGLSLTAIMASVLFLLVYINPKEDNYGSLPLVYSGASIIGSIVLYRFAVRFESKGSAQTIQSVG